MDKKAESTVFALNDNSVLFAWFSNCTMWLLPDDTAHNSGREKESEGEGEDKEVNGGVEIQVRLGEMGCRGGIKRYK